jgi:hypothetical protein
LETSQKIASPQNDMRKLKYSTDEEKKQISYVCASVCNQMRILKRNVLVDDMKKQDSEKR